MRILFIFISVLTLAISTPLYSSSLTNSGSTANIRRLPCISTRTGKTGVCMFALDCVKANGTHLGTCLDRFYFGSCCRINVETDTYPHDNTIKESSSLIPTKKPLESNDIPEIVTIHHFQPQKPSVSTATPVSTIASTLTSTLAKPMGVFTNKPIVTTAVTDRLTSTGNIWRPTRPSSTILLTTKPFESVTELTSFSSNPLIGLPTTGKLSQPSSTEVAQLNTTMSNKTKPSSKPTKISFKPMKTSSKPLLTDSARPTEKPKPSSKPTRYQKPSKPMTTTTSTTVETAPENSSSTLSSSKKTTTATTSGPTTIISRPLGDLIKNSEETPTTVKIISSTSDNHSTPFQFLTTTDNFISQVETSTKIFVTWSSNSDELVTSTMVSPTTSMLSTTKERDETAETEWSSITSPSGWIMIHNLSTKQPENELSTPNEISSTIIQSLLDSVPTTEKVSLPTRLPTIDHPTLTTVTTNPTDRYNMSDYKQVCGRRLFPESRIVGGSRSSFGKWPWQISLRQWRNSAHLHKCGAALLNENWAITAAHCVENVPPSELLLRIGEYNLANEDEPYGFQERRVHMVASHPAFDPRTFEYDLTLIRFHEPLKPFQPNYLPICVPDDDEGYVGQVAYVTGWGRLYEDGPLPSVLQEVSVPIINNSECEEMYRAAGYIEHIPKIFICAGWKKGGSDSCEGDSGGPLVIRRPRDNRWILAGVISWGIGCAMPFQPGVYTRISEFKEWINQILKF